jgi:kumamolisin
LACDLELLHADPVGLALQLPRWHGQGQCIGIIELGGGYRPTDLQKYFSELGIPLPKVATVSVDHGKNQPPAMRTGRTER